MNPNAPTFIPGHGLVYPPITTTTQEEESISSDHQNSTPSLSSHLSEHTHPLSITTENSNTNPPSPSTLVSDTQNLSITDPSHNTETDIDPREPVNVIFLGHVDSGKSTTSGQVLLLTGMVNERLIEKYTKEAIEKKHTSWFLAYIMDALEEERSKGKTVEVGRAHFYSKIRRYTILDAPGHKYYIPNMMIGLCQADISILVISARKGEFEAGYDKHGQTREHILLARALGVRLLVICINKMDDPTVNWDKGRYDNIVERLTPFLQSMRFNIKRDVLFMPISGLTGLNIKDRISSDICPWFDGKSLIDTLDALPPFHRNPSAPLRLPVLDKHKDMGLVIMGKIEQGTLRKNHQYLVIPGNVTVEITEIENDGGPIKLATPGENVQFGLRNIDDSLIHRGSIICDLKSPVHAITEFIAQIMIVDLPADKVLITSGSTAIIHIHTAVSEIAFIKLLAELDKNTGLISKKLPKYAKSKSLMHVHFQVPLPLPIETFKESPQLGRFTLRDEDKTIGFGQVLHLGAPRIKKVIPLPH